MFKYKLKLVALSVVKIAYFFFVMNEWKKKRKFFKRSFYSSFPTAFNRDILYYYKEIFTQYDNSKGCWWWCLPPVYNIAVNCIEHVKSSFFFQLIKWMKTEANQKVTHEHNEHTIEYYYFSMLLHNKKKTNGIKSKHKANAKSIRWHQRPFYNCIVQFCQTHRFKSSEGDADVNHHHHHHRCLLPIKLHFIFLKKEVHVEKCQWEKQNDHIRLWRIYHRRHRYLSENPTPTHRLASYSRRRFAADHIQQRVYSSLCQRALSFATAHYMCVVYTYTYYIHYIMICVCVYTRHIVYHQPVNLCRPPIRLIANLFIDA